MTKDNTGFKDLRKYVSCLVQQVIERGVSYELKREIEKVDSEGNVLIEEALNASHEFRGGEVKHLKYLARCLSGKADFHYDEFVQKNHGYDGVVEFMSLENPDLRRVESIREGLSPEDPLELLLLDGLRFMEMKGNVGAEVDIGADIDERGSMAGYVGKLVEVIEGDRPYRRFSVVSGKTGETHTNIRIL